LLLNAAKDLEKQAVQLSAGWERDLASPWMTLSRLARCCR
jgi:hypothetical protein